MVFLSTPVQRPRVPVWVGGFWPNKAPMRRVARWEGAARPPDVSSVPVLGPEDFSQSDMARIMSEVLATPVRYARQSLADFRATLARYGMGDAFVQGMADVMRAKDEGLGDGVPRIPETVSPTTFRQWCEEVLKPAVLA